jgi:hypothetical protein
VDLDGDGVDPQGRLLPEDGEDVLVEGEDVLDVARGERPRSSAALGGREEGVDIEVGGWQPR